MSSVKMLAACRTSLARFIQSSERLVFITGAGVSTDSGIPDYRSPGRPPYKPMTHQEFVNAQFTRQRYWARSVVGYRLMTSAQPNSVHKALAQLEEKGHRCHIITQNVDELHQKAGSENVLNLHGSIHYVRCSECDSCITRTDFQEILLESNDYMRDFADPRSMPQSQRPDGDIDLLNDDLYRRFTVPECWSCGVGRVHPDVVLFGGSLSAEVRNKSLKLITDSDGVVVLGSTLSTFSAFRLLSLAREHDIPAFLINDGETRADKKNLFSQLDAGQTRFHARLHETVPQAVDIVLSNS
eukprot:m.147257 g.147257  ORF g.147257 m.147257 type:complete len:298 (+) comp14163_c0_seq2:112-1005(+)